MFLALAVEEAMGNRWQKWRMRMRGEDLLWQNASFGGNRYIAVIWRGEAERIPWGRIAGVTNRPRTPVLAPPGVTPPENCPCRIYEPQDFYTRLTVQAARQCLLQVPEKARRAVVGIIDPQGIAPWVCPELAECCKALTVYSLRPERYRKSEGMLLGEFGMPLLYAEKPEALRECLLCIAPYPTGVIAVSAPVITTDRSGIQGSPTINRLSLRLPEAVRAAIPPGVCPELFLGAVVETGQRRVDIAWEVEACRIDGRLAPLSDIGKSVLREKLDITKLVDYNK